MREVVNGGRQLTARLWIDLKRESHCCRIAFDDNTCAFYFHLCQTYVLPFQELQLEVAFSQEVGNMAAKLRVGDVTQCAGVCRVVGHDVLGARSLGHAPVVHPVRRSHGLKDKIDVTFPVIKSFP